MFMVHLATIPVTGTGINPARSFGAAVIYNKDKIWDDHVINPLSFFINYYYYFHFKKELVSLALSGMKDKFIKKIEIQFLYNFFWYSGFSGLDHSLELPQLLSTTNTF